MLTTLAGAARHHPPIAETKDRRLYPVSVQTPQRDIGTMSGLQNIPGDLRHGNGSQLLGGLSTTSDTHQCRRLPLQCPSVIDIYATPQT